MAKKIGVLSQKGGVGKSTTARAIGREYALAGWNTKIIDFDINQATCVEWRLRREKNTILKPEVAVETFRTVNQVIKTQEYYDLLIFDGVPNATAATLEIAQHCDAVFLPTGLSLDDLRPTVLLAHELVDKKISHEKIAFVLCRVGESEAEILEAKNYIKKAGYIVLDNVLPEKIGYRRASDDGRAITEAAHPSLKVKAELFTQNIVNFLNIFMR